ncbi:MAG: hypothetical protein ACFE8P_17095 [Promethearchaeota archaeon]
MVIESLVYLQNSSLNLASVILQPEISYNPTFIAITKISGPSLALLNQAP